jgi:CheY-like chemotaxis protein
MAHPNPKSTSIVVADDSALERARLSAIVRALGYVPVEVADSMQVVDTVCATRPFLVLLDVVMGPPNGFEVCRQLRDKKDTREIPIVLCSVKATEVDHMWAKQLGAAGYLAKPFDAERAKLFLSRQIERTRASIKKLESENSGGS